MPSYNVALTVVELIEAANPAEAEAQLRARLDTAGFEVYDDPDPSMPAVFESDVSLPPVPTPDDAAWYQGGA